MSDRTTIDGTVSVEQSDRAYTAFAMAKWIWQATHDDNRPKSADDVQQFLNLTDKCSQSLAGRGLRHNIEGVF